MCGPYTVTKRKADELTKRSSAILSAKEALDDGLGRYNVAPAQRVPAVVLGERGERSCACCAGGSFRRGRET